MFRYFEQLSSRIAAPFMAESSRNSKVWQCRCGQSLFFRNSQCLACSALLGYQPRQSRLSSLQPGPVEGTWLQDDNLDAGAFRRCANSTPGRNWLIPAHSTAPCAWPVASSHHSRPVDPGKPRALAPGRDRQTPLVAQLIAWA